MDMKAGMRGNSLSLRERARVRGYKSFERLIVFIVSPSSCPSPAGRRDFLLS
jgi:hypothetical protein